MKGEKERGRKEPGGIAGVGNVDPGSASRGGWDQSDDGFRDREWEDLAVPIPVEA